MQISTDVLKSIEYVRKHFGYKDFEPVLSMHARGHVWREPQFRALNNITIDQLRELLGQQSVTPTKGADDVRQIVRIIRNGDLERERKTMLELDTDYLLACLYEAMQAQDTDQIAQLKAELADNQRELEGIQL